MSDVISAEVPLALVSCIVFVLVGLALKQYHEDNRSSGRLWVHESMITALFGLIVGGLFEYFTHRDLSFDSNLFFYLVLPPIIFSAGFSLKRKKFFRFGLSIATFGILGTLMNFTMISFAAHIFSLILGIPRMTWTRCMVLGSVLSASDEVSAMSIVRMKDYPHLGALIFGEGVLNDALSIVIFKTLQTVLRNEGQISNSGDIGTDESIISETVSSIDVLLSVFFLLIASSVIGLTFGLLNARFLKSYPQARHDPISQTSLVLLFGMLSYGVAECLGCSGILTLFVAAVTLSHYSWHSLSRSAQVCTKLSLCSMSDIAEGFAFAYVGLSMWGFTGENKNITFAVLMLITVVGARFFTIFALCNALRGLSDEFNLSFSEQVGFGLGGIVRGCLCWAQILQLQNEEMLVTTTLFVVMVTIVACGILLPAVMPLVVVPIEDSSDQLPGNMTLANIIPDDSMLSAHDPPTTPSKKDRMPVRRHVIISLFYVLWVRFDENFMKVFFGGATADTNEGSTRNLVLRSTEDMSIWFMLTHPAAIDAIFDGINKPQFEQNSAVQDRSADFDDAYLANLIAEDEMFAISPRSLPYSPIRIMGTPDMLGNRISALKSRPGPMNSYSLHYHDMNYPGISSNTGLVRGTSDKDLDDYRRDSITDYYTQQLQGVIKFRDDDEEQENPQREIVDTASHYYQLSV